MTDLLSASTYRLLVFGMDVSGNVGPTTAFNWTTTACVPVESAASLTVLNLQQVSPSLGVRFFQWSTAAGVTGYQYSLDGGNWLFTTTTTGTNRL